MSGRYTRPAMVLHWLMALLILSALPLGLYMSDLPLSPYKLKLFAWHKWIGITVLALWLPRVAWRITHRPPALPPGLPLWQERAAAITHGLLYLLMLAVPLTGWLMSSALGFTVVWLGVLPLPNLVAPDKALGATLKFVHSLLADGLMGLLALHLLAVLQHQLLLRDRLLWRMVSWGGKK